MVSSPRTIASLLLGVSILLIPAALSAQQRGVNQFFESNAVDNFTVPVVTRDGVGFQYFMDNEAKKKQIEEELNAEQPQPVAQAPAAPKDQPAAPAALNSSQDILATYGDPGKDMPVLAQENAPKPFKAMMAAFEVGDDQLAYGYARQWVRYMDNIKKRTERVVEAARAAQAGEKVVTSGTPEGDRIKQMIANDNSELTANLDPRAQQILAQAKADEALEGGQQAPQNNMEQEEVKAREVIRKQLAGRVPVDPKGKVDVYVFFAPNDANGKTFAPIANQIAKRISLMNNAHFATFSTARLNRDALARERRRLELTTDLLAGDSFARELKLTTLPAIVLVSPSTGKIIRETADKPFVFYDELIAAVQGRK